MPPLFCHDRGSVGGGSGGGGSGGGDGGGDVGGGDVIQKLRPDWLAAVRTHVGRLSTIRTDVSPQNSLPNSGVLDKKKPEQMRTEVKLVLLLRFEVYGVVFKCSTAAIDIQQYYSVYSVLEEVF